LACTVSLVGRCMGFFSRLFQPRADGLQAPSDWTRLPENDASELVLFDDEAHKLMAQFDIDAAIVTHERWLPWLAAVLQGARDERLRPPGIDRPHGHGIGI